MLVRFDVTVVTSSPTGGVLEGLPVGENRVVYVDLASVNYATDTSAGGSITTTAVQRIVVEAVVGNVTFNRISLASEKITSSYNIGVVGPGPAVFISEADDTFVMEDNTTEFIQET